MIRLGKKPNFDVHQKLFMDPSGNNEEIVRQIEETNKRLKSVQNLLIGVLISTAVLAVIFILIYTKFNQLINRSMEDF